MAHTNEATVLREEVKLMDLARRAARAEDLHALITVRPRVKAQLEARGSIRVLVYGRDCDGVRFCHEREFHSRTPIELEQAFVEDASWADGPINYSPVC